MKQKEIITIEDVCGQTFRVRVVEASENGKAAFTHFLHNHKSNNSEFFKREALQHVKRALEYKFPSTEISSKAASDALQYMLFNFLNNTPFPGPSKPKFTFIDLFAGIGGFRLAMQSLGGKCVFTSEWDEQAKKTYEMNFGEVPFGDITKEDTKRFIPDNFDVLCAGFPCQAFSIAGKRGGFEDTRGTLFFDVAEIIKRKQPKAFFLENVKGLFNHDKGKTNITILNVLRKDLGYIFHDPQIINAKDFGVPQNRERVFMLALERI